jgi:RHS repeat-associated protein
MTYVPAGSRAPSLVFPVPLSTYDALGRRVSKYVLSAVEGTINGIITTFQYDGLDAIRENGGAGVATYLRTLAIDEALTRTEGDTTATYLSDILGSTVALTDASGAPVTTYTYAPFGEVSISGASSSNAFQFTGRENDGTRLYYYRARYYDPIRSRFVSEDSIGLVAGINRLTYTSNNPLRSRDPLGLIEWPFDAPMPWNDDVLEGPSFADRLVPRYGNWCGPGWSGGQWGPREGPNPPVDSLDTCCQVYDRCYGERGCYGNDSSKVTQCDEALIRCERQLSKDPKSWSVASPSPDYANSYRKWLDRIFKRWTPWGK